MTNSFNLNNIDFKVDSLKDLPLLKKIMDANNLKPNYSAIARRLGVDRRTVKKHYEGFKPKKRKKPSKIDKFRPIIDELLDPESIQVFYSKRVLWQYLKDNHGLDVSDSTFRRYISKIPKYQEYFDKSKGRKNNAKLRFETSVAEQAQIDWKENMKFVTKNGEVIKLNVFVFILSHSRYRIFHVSERKSQDVLLSFLTQCFEHIGGVPKTIVCDNLKTVMDEARTSSSKGKINNKFQEFMNDFKFKLKPCMANRPQTKGKVESSMKLLDEIYTYQGKLDYKEVEDLVEQINIRVNMDIHQGTKQIPLKLLEIEKDHLIPLPGRQIRDLYLINDISVKVNSSNMITYKGNQYSVPSEYENSTLTLQVEDNHLYLYDNTKLVTKHQISNKRLNYHYDDYLQLAKSTWTNKSEKELIEQAKNNLKKIGEMYEY